VLLLVLVSGTSARSATLGTISIGPATGASATVSTFTTSGLCPAGDTVTLKVFGGSGTGAVIATPATQFSPKNMNGTVDAATYVNVAGDKMVIGATQTWKDFATTGTPPLSKLNGVYTVRAWCSSGDWFEGAITFTGTTTDAATYTTTATPSPTPTTASPTPTTASPTPTTASPTPTTASPTPTSPSPTLTSTATSTPTGTATSTVISSPSPSPSSTALKPGEQLGIAVGPDGSFLLPNATLRAGDNVTMMGGGFGPGSLLKYSVFSQEVVFGYGYADGNGSTSYRFVVPNLPDGNHRFAISGANKIVVFPFILGASTSTATVTPTPGSPSPSATDAAAGGTGSSGEHLAATGVGAGITTMLLLAMLVLAVGANLKLPRLETATASGRHADGGGRRATARQVKGRHQ
jgi:hypothetical protein